MSELKKGNAATAEYKAKVGLEAVRGVKTINEISQMYSVHPTQVGLCKKIQSPLQNYSGVANYGDRNILETSTISGSHVAQLTEF